MEKERAILNGLRRINKQFRSVSTLKMAAGLTDVARAQLLVPSVRSALSVFFDEIELGIDENVDRVAVRQNPNVAGGLDFGYIEEPQNPLDREIGLKTDTVLTRNRSVLFDEGPEAFQSLEEAILSAEKSIQINISSWAPDSTGMRFAKLLIEKKRINPALKIQVRVDKLAGFLIDADKNLMKPSILAPIFMKIMLKYPQIKFANLIHLIEHHNDIYDADAIEKDFILTRIGEFLTKELLLKINPALKMLDDAGILEVADNSLDKIDHTKIWCIDDKFYLSEMNVGDEYSGGYDTDKQKWGRGEHWKDHVLCLEGPALAIGKRLFFDPAASYEGAKIPKEQGSPLRILENKSGDCDVQDDEFPKTKQISYAIESLIDHAETEIFIEHAYILDDRIVTKLQAAAARGVNITIIVGKPESRAFARANKKFLDKLRGVTGIRLRQLKVVLHSKVLMVDGNYAILGSANLSRASLREHREIAFMVSGEDNVLLKEIVAKCRSDQHKFVPAETSLHLAGFLNRLRGVIR